MSKPCANKVRKHGTTDKCIEGKVTETVHQSNNIHLFNTTFKKKYWPKTPKRAIIAER